MANGKLDMGKAWTQATAMMGANRDTISAVAGLFFFLPSFAAALFVPELVNPEPAKVDSDDPEIIVQAAMEHLTAIYADNWPVFLAITVAGFIGSITLLALLSDRGNPTVREALSTGLRRIPTYLGAQLLSALGAGLVIGLPLGLLGAFASPTVTVLVGLLLVIVLVYLIVKFSLIAPAIAIEGIRNPIAAITRSWQLTKGNSLRIFGFILLLFVTISIILALVQGVLTLIFAAIGGEVANIGNGVVSAAVNTLITVIFLVVIAAVHRQLAGNAPDRLAEAFE